MGRTVAREDGHIGELTDEQSWQLVDRVARLYLDISGEEFLSRWEPGYYASTTPHSLALMAPAAMSYNVDRLDRKSGGASDELAVAGG